MNGSISSSVALRLTRFPNLTGCRLSDRIQNDSATHQHTWELDEDVLPLEVWAAGWATLLQRYTNVETPVFNLNGRPVYVSNPMAADPKIEEADVVTIDEDGCTGIYTSSDSQPTTSHALALILHSKTKIGQLQASQEVPATFLSQIAEQLMEIILPLAGGDKSRRYSPSTLSRSISNPTPATLEGPSFFDGLLESHHNSGDIAIEYCPSKGHSLRLSYTEMHERAEILSHHISEAYKELCVPIGSSPIIPLLIPQHPNLYTSMIAILRCGGAFCPLNLDAPIARIQFVANDVQAKILLTVSDLRPQLSELEEDIKIICVDQLPVLKEAMEDHPARPTPDSPAYVMYTSGSTGQPKGVPISHRAATQALLAHDPHIPQFNRFLQFASPTFDVSVFEIFFPLFRGATLVCSERERLLTDLPKAINELEIDAVELTPTVAGTLLQSRKNAPKLKALLTIGEMLTERVVKEFGSSDDSNDGILVALYGPTEATIHCTIDPQISPNSVVGNIGKPLSTVSAFVLSYSDSPDSNQESDILPIGQIGELAVGGSQLSHGYINRPEQTKAAFVQLPGHGTVYRTGDKARLLPNGLLECLGRISNTQVKLRGQRIELGEIEQTAYKVEDIELASAAVIDGALIIFCSSSVDVPVERVKLACEKWLPRYMRPNDIIMMKDVPRLPSGKVDKKALEKAYKSSNQASHVEFESDLERDLATLIGQQLGIQPSREQRLAAYGLDSIRAIGVASKLRAEGFQISVAELLGSDTVAEIASIVNSNATETSDFQQKASEIRDRLSVATRNQIQNPPEALVDVDICTPMQSAMLSETMSDTNANCNWFELELNQKLNLDNLLDAFRQIASRNDIFRSGFVFVEEVSMFARVIWKELKETQFRTVDQFDYDYHLKKDFTILAPFSCQLLRDGTMALFHAHHAIFDGWSLDQLVLDLQKVLSGEAVEIRPSYHQVSGYYAAYIDSSTYSKDKDYWRSTLEGSKPYNFPILRPTRENNSHDICVRGSTPISAKQLDETAKKNGVSRPSFVMAAYAYLLGRYNGASDSLFGVVSSGRTIPVAGIERILGPCLTTLPLSVDFSEHRTSKDLIVQCHRTNREALAHEQLPLTEIKILSGCPSDEQLFDSILVWQESPASKAANDQIFVRDNRDRLQFALVLEIEPKPESLHFKLTCKSQVIPLQQAQIFCDELSLLLQSFVMEIERPIQNLNDIFTSDPKVLSATNLEFTSLPESECGLASNIESIAENDPQRPALEFVTDFDPITDSINRHILTYGQLNEQAGQVARYLNIQGIGPDDLVGIWMEKSPEQYISVLAAIKSGAGYLPLDPSTPAARVRQIIEEANVHFVLSVSTFEKTKEVTSYATIINIDKPLQLNDDQPWENVHAQGSNVAYAVFTSGTTGKPKGLIVTRKNITSNIRTLAKLYPHDKSSRLLQSCSPAFDVAVFEIFFTWDQGMCLVSARNDILFRDMEAFIRSTKVTHLSLTPSVAGILDRSKIPGVGFLVTAGEALSQKVFRDWGDGKSLYQGYGPAETTNICTVNPRMIPENIINTLGPPLANTSAFVIDERSEFKILPQGFIGEFCFGGDQVCRGYLGSPTLTAEKFINHPQYGWLYRSGDMGRMLADGSLVFLGRKDDQVKIRGQRVELKEIDQAMLSLSYISDCATLIVQGHDKRTERLVCFWTGEKEIKSSSDITNSLAERLPSYMVPDDVIYLERLPRTVQGKTDKRSLTETYQGIIASRVPDDHINGTRPLTDVEQRIAEAVADICQVQPVEIFPETSFLRLGLDSIKAIGLSRKLRNLKLGQIDVSTILRNNSVVRLASVISKTQDRPESVSVDPASVFNSQIRDTISKDFAQQGLKVQKILPCTPLQETMLSESSSSGGAAYQNEVVLRVHGDLSQLKNAWNIMIQRHEILRACFVSTEDPQFPFAQVILENHNLPWIDGSVNGDISKPGLAASNSQRPPWEICILHEPATTLKITMHHALYDAEAFSILLHEVENVYLHQELPPAPSLEGYITQALSARQPEALSFWRELLNQFQPTPMIDSIKADGKATTYESAKMNSQISLNHLRKRCSKLSFNSSSVFEAAWARLLTYFTSTQDVCFGNVFGGRDTHDTESLVAPCFNTLPVRAQLRQLMTNAELINDIQSKNLSILPYQASSLRLIQSELRIKTRRLFDTLILIQKPDSPLNSSVWTIESEDGIMAFPMILEVLPVESSDQITLLIHADTLKLPHGLLSPLLKVFDDILANTISFQSSQCSDYSFLGDEKVLREYQTIPKLKSEDNQEDGSQPPPETLKHAISEVRKSVAALAHGVTEESIEPKMTIFQLGLDSINAFQLASRLAKSGYIISAADILDAATIQQIAIRVLQKPLTNGTTSTIDFADYDNKHRKSLSSRFNLDNSIIQQVRPCTKAQSGMLAQFLNSNGKTYLNSIEYETSLPRETTINAWHKMTEIHELLRTGFAQVDDPIYPFAMITYDSDKFELPLVDNIKGDEDVSQLMHQNLWRIQVDDQRVRILMHHALYDAQSLRSLLQGVHEFGLGGKVFNPVSLQPLLETMITADLDSEQSKSFWQASASNIQPSKFPNLHASTGHSSSFKCISLKSTRTLPQIQEGCKTLGITLQAAGQVAWAQILSAYIGESNVTFGVVLSTRPSRDGMDQVVFPCVNTLPVLLDTSLNTQEQLDRISKHNVELIRAPNTPLSNIQRWVNIYESLFDTVFVYQKLPAEDETTYTPKLNDDIAITEYALSIEIIPGQNQSLDFQLTYDTALIPEMQAKLIVEQFNAILTSNVLFPSGDLVLEDRLLSVEPASTYHIEAPVDLLHEFVDFSTSQYPEKLALEFYDAIDDNLSSRRRWNYTEVQAEGNRFANLLLKHGCEPGELVGICFDKCPEASFAMLGILKAGCALVALDPGAPVSRKEYILKDAKCRFLMTTSDKVSDLAHVQGVETLAVDDKAIFEGVSTSAPALARKILPSDVCYCLYTSGTTGNPKGCLISHDNAVQAMMAFNRLFAGHWNLESRWLQFASFHFDVNILEQYFTWGVGICLVSTPRDVLLENLAVNINQMGITHIDLTPSLARLVTPEEAASLCNGIFITGGEQLRKEVLDAWGDYEVIYNGYGPSEVTIGCTMHPRVKRNTKPSNIGPQFDNVGSYVMKPGTEEPVLRGAIGELCVTGPLVGIGYLNRPDLTTEKFPELKERKERMYRTGDLVRILYDGTFDFLGRIDDQVKLRGQRLEIGEINEVVRQSTKVHDVATLVLKHPSQPKEQLVTFFAMRKVARSAPLEPQLGKEQLETAAKIRSAMANKLPSYMISSFIIPISRIPLSSNNKVEAKMLRALFEGLNTEDLRATTDVQGSDSEVNQEVVAKIQDVLAQVLSISQDDVQLSSSFFELGLDSISAISFARALRKAGISDIHSSMIMKYSTVSGLAGAIAAAEGSSAKNQVTIQASKQRILAFAHKHSLTISQQLGLSSDDIEAIAPCTPLQAGMIARTMQLNRPVYHSTFEFALDPTVDLQRLKSAWSTAQQKLQLLRTRFVSTEDGFAQVASVRGDDFWQIIDQIPSHEEAIRTIEDWKINSANSLESQPWMIHIQDSSESRAMHLSIFHGLYDGISLDLLLEFVGRLYLNGNVEEQVLNFFDILPYGPLSEVDGAKDFWTKRPLPTTLIGLKMPTSQQTLTFSENIPGSEKLVQCRNTLKVTEPAIFQAAWLLTIFEHFKKLPTHGIVVSGRSIDFEGAESVIGPMFNTLPCYIDASRCGSWAELVESCHEFNTSILTYQHTPLRDIMKWKKRSTSEQPFDSLFVFQKEDSATKTTDKLWTVRGSSSSADYPLALEVEQKRDGSFSVTLVSATSIQEEQLHQLFETLRVNLQQLIQDPTQQLPDEMRAQKIPLDDSQAGQASQINGLYEEAISEELKVVRKEVSVLAEMEVDQVNPKSSIFELGLDSIDAIKLSARLKEAGLAISMSRIMQLRSVQEIAANCKATKTTTEQNDVAFDEQAAQSLLIQRGIDVASFEKVLPATPLQEGLISSMVASEFQQYFNHEMLKVEANVDMGRLLTAWEAVIRDNAILRTSFVEIDDPNQPFTYLQVVNKQHGQDWNIVQAQQEGDLDRLLTEAQKTAASQGLEKTPMFSITPIEMGHDKFLLHSMAHALYDGMSMSMLHHDVALAYQGQSQQRLPYDAFVTESLNQSGQAALEFWKDQLRGMTSTRFPSKANTTSNPSIHKFEHQSIHSEDELSSFCKSQDITLQTLGLTCWMLILAQRTHGLDVCTGLVLSGRSFKDAEDIMFPTMNTVAFRSVIHGSASAMLQYVQDTSAKISEFQHFPLRKARSAAGISDQPFDSIFLFQRIDKNLSGHQPLYQALNATSSTEYPVNVEWEVVDSNIVFRTACSDTVFDASETTKLLQDVDQVLSYILKDPSSSVLNFSEHQASICDLSGFSLTNGNSTTTSESVENLDEKDSTEITTLEKTIIDVLAKVANVPGETLKKTTSLFEIGIDSISAIKVSSIMRKQSIRLTVSDMMKAITVERMARVARKINSETSQNHSNLKNNVVIRSDASAFAERFNLKVSAIESILPVTAGQEYMLQMWKNSNHELFYPAFYYELGGNISSTDLEAAWSTLCKETPILRTTFYYDSASGQFSQVILKDIVNPLRWLDNPAKDVPESPASPVQLQASRAGKIILLRIQLHHALYDAVSLPMIISGLEKLCNHRPLNINNDFFSYVRASTDTSLLKERKEFWTSYFKDLSPLSTKVSQDRGRTELYQPRLFTNLDPIYQKSRAAGISIQSMFFALYARTYLQYQQSSAQSDQELVFGIYMANRSHDIDNLSNLAAPTVNIVPLRVLLSQEAASNPLSSSVARDALFKVASKIQEDLSEISRIEYSGASLSEIYQWTQGRVRVDTIVNFLRLPDTEEDEGIPIHNGEHGVRIRPIEQQEFEKAAGVQSTGLPPPPSPLPFNTNDDEKKDDAYIVGIDIEASIRNGGLDVGLFAPADVLDQPAATKMLDEIRQGLEEIAS